MGMYFRIKKTPSGQVLQLVESYRDAENRPRQRIVISLGDAAIPEEHRVTIAKAVEKQLHGVKNCLALVIIRPYNSGLMSL